jgi:7,8-dihydroneopterin aldolase/epimerase/oxygenase
MMKDIVFCEGLELDMEIGFHEVELGKKQTVLVDLTLEANFAAGPTQDELEGLVDYHTISRLVQENVAPKRYQLVEALAVDIARVIVLAYPHVTARVRVQKTPLDMPRVRAVGVECVRSAADFAA